MSLVVPISDEAASIGADPVRTPRSAYVHIPFCAHKCGYCDFASVAGKDDRAKAYLEALELELASLLCVPKRVRTIFVGGGTPTYLDPPQLADLLEMLIRWFEPDGVEEFTVESNPNTLTAEKVGILADHGVDRVSLGAQSFQPGVLEVLERNHDPASVPRAVEAVRRRIENVSLDLIFGAPGQTLPQWKEDLRRALELEPNHLSLYGLTYEKGTRLWSQRRQGIVRPIDEETERRLYEHAIDRLTGLGWDHYEISNFARRPADRCRHNLVYWANHACYGFGTGAAAYVDGVRTLNTRELDAYIERLRNGRSPVSQTERLGPQERARETAMLNLRRTSGLVFDEFEESTGWRFDELVGQQFREFAELGLIARDDRSVRLTQEGLFVADAILQAVL